MATKKPDLQEVGTTGLRRSGGTIHEEFINNLRGLRGAKTYREMADNDPTVGGMIFAVEKIIAGLDWRVDPFSDDSTDGKTSKADEEVATFVESCLNDMEDSWEQTVIAFLSFLIFGYGVHELVYKVRGGSDGDLWHKSQYDDGKIGWRKMPIRSQETLFRWDYDPKTNELIAMVQSDPSNGGMHTIPLEKALHFKTTSHKANPEGRSILRNVYRPWFYGRRLEEIEAIGVERDLAGLPVMFVPPEILSSDATDADKALAVTLQNVVTNVKRNEQEGLLMPMQYDEQGHLIYDFKLLSTGGSRQFNTNEIIMRYDQRKTMALLSDFLLLGHSGTGARSLGITKMELWTMAIDSIANTIAGVFNSQAITRLLKLNGMDTKRPPKLNYGQVQNADLTEIAGFVTSLAQAGVLLPDAKLEDFLREIGGLPPAAPDGTGYGMPQVPAVGAGGRVPVDANGNAAVTPTQQATNNAGKTPSSPTAQATSAAASGKVKPTKVVAKPKTAKA
jgi:hypothetical protein